MVALVAASPAVPRLPAGRWAPILGMGAVLALTWAVVHATPEGAVADPEAPACVGCHADEGNPPPRPEDVAAASSLAMTGPERATLVRHAAPGGRP